MTAFEPALHSGTPSITVHDNRGLAIRQIAYHRHPDTPAQLDARITRQRFDPRGLLAMSIDPRLHERQQSVPDSKPNFLLHAALSGEVLRSESVDAGTTFQLGDTAGRALWRCGATGVSHRWHYEQAPLTGRLLAMEEQALAGAGTMLQRLVWSDHDQIAKDHNLAGQVARHYDTAGRNETASVGLSGGLLVQTRRLLAQGAEADWQGADETAWEALLAAPAYTTQAEVDATGETVFQLDAKGHGQRHAYDIAGLLASSWLTLRQGTPQPILKAVLYAASGQVLGETHGNDVLTTCRYEPRTQRLTGITTQRPAGHANGAKVLQDLRYSHDPVGNVLGVRNDAEAPRFWRNLRVEPENRYVYDSLYQLVSASGRETLGNPWPGVSHPPVTLPLPPNDATLTPYTRRYDYDRGGNLTGIAHTAPAPGASYNLRMTVSASSNRAVPEALAQDPAAVDGLFDAAGHQLLLQPGQPLGWNLRGELEQAVRVVREAHASDFETYRYDGASQRVEKFASQQAGGATHVQRALYLPGLELRTRHIDATLSEDLQVITLAQTGRAQVRVLHWESGKPGGVANDSVRYSHDDLIGSVGLEVDDSGQVISLEEYYPYGGTSVWTARSQVEANYKTLRYSGKERDATGLYYYGYRYYQPWAGRWLSADPAGTVDGLNLYGMVLNNPVTLRDVAGLDSTDHGVRDALFHIHRAMKLASRMFENTAADVDDFIESKRTYVTFAGFLNVGLQIVGSGFGALGKLAGAPAGPVGALLGGEAAKLGAKAFSHPMNVIPKTDLVETFEHELLPDSKKILEAINKFAGPEALRDKLIDKGLNEGGTRAAQTISGAAKPLSVAFAGDYLSLSIPFMGLYKIAKELYSAKDVSKEEVLGSLQSSIETMKQVLTDAHQAMISAFETLGTDFAYQPTFERYLGIAGPGKTQRVIFVGSHAGKVSGVIRLEQFNKYHASAMRQLAKLEDLVNKHNLQRASSSRGSASHKSK